MKGSAITGPVGKEAAELWPVRLPPFLYAPRTQLIMLCSVSHPTLVSSCKRVKRNGCLLISGFLAWKGMGLLAFIEWCGSIKNT
jgi:hypothetical protein